jgi:hypothetical protein
MRHFAEQEQKLNAYVQQARLTSGAGAENIFKSKLDGISRLRAEAIRAKESNPSIPDHEYKQFIGHCDESMTLITARMAEWRLEMGDTSLSDAQASRSVEIRIYWLTAALVIYAFVDLALRLFLGI